MCNHKSRSTDGILRRTITAAMASACIGMLLVSGASSGEENYLPRKWEKFELGKTVDEMKNALTLFRCSEPTSKATRCMLMGYPGRDDFAVLKFYDNKLASAAQFRYKFDWERAFAQFKDELGDPTLPAYRSYWAVAYIWQDSKTHITLTRLIQQNYLVYEIRDLTTEPLYRKSVAGS